MASITVDQGLSDSKSLLSYLPSHVREQVELGDPRRNQCLQAMEALNAFFKEVLEITCSYRFELGTTLQRMVECYNSLLLQMIGLSITKENKVAGTNEYQDKIDEINARLEQMQAQEQEFRDCSSNQQLVLESKDR